MKERMYNRLLTYIETRLRAVSLPVLAQFFGMLLLLTGCADMQHHIEPCLQGHTYGFWGGFWHGLIAPISFLCSLFNDNVAVWAVNNNGGWYTFGFVLGSGILFGGSSSAASKK